MWRALGPPPTGALPEPAELPLAQRAVDNDGLRLAGLDSDSGSRHGGARPATARQPRHGRPAQLVQAEVRGHERRGVAVVAERAQPVDVANVHAGVRTGTRDRLDGEGVLTRVGDAAPLRVARLPHADDAGPTAHELSSARTSSVCSPNWGGRRLNANGEPCATNGAPQCMTVP